MKLRIEITCDNAAFEDDCLGEIERLLRTVTDRLAFSGETEMVGALVDANGNKVGQFSVEQS